MNPVKLDTNFNYAFQGNFEEININVDDSIKLNSLLFKSDMQPPKGIIFNLKGAGGNISNQDEAATIYNEEGYDFYVMDFRGYGKSQGAYNNDLQMYNDGQAAYDKLLERGYKEDDIIIIGVSLGTGVASYLAKNNSPGQLILISPYYSMKDLARNLTLPNLKYLQYLPTDLLIRYNLDNAKHIKNIKAPVAIFHGTDDRLIYYGSSLKLKDCFKPKDTLITIKGGIHNGFESRPDVIEGIKEVINGLK
ncbi:alpha/beta fold hydrolase [Galbibacter sp. BG1]|uniref:alpha/beta hydrolase n=1 Tax=Galbibacter sp. BG1 TaxID=1170699 RepID=UPI0015BA46CC|nr:alpha/beta fold hydrolase [Galbibacter sp. BG1]QLE00350.1 alpha/beta fold hydrolase [Galbibacter sp. BG1]